MLRKEKKVSFLPMPLIWVIGVLVLLYAGYLIQTGELGKPGQPKRKVAATSPVPSSAPTALGPQNFDNEATERQPHRREKPQRSDEVEMVPLDEVMPEPTPVQEMTDGMADGQETSQTEPETTESSPGPPASPAPDASPDPAAESRPVQSALTELVRQPKLLPGSIRLLQATEFPLTFGGKPAGRVMLPAGSSVAVKESDGVVVTVAYGESTMAVPIDRTDFEERLRENARRAGEREATRMEMPATDVPAPSASGTGGSTPWWMETKPGSQVAGSSESAEWAKRLGVDVTVRRKGPGDSAKPAGESIRLRVRLSNSGISSTMESLRVTLWMLGESSTDRRLLTVIGSETIPATVGPRATVELTSKDFARNSEGGNIMKGASDVAGWAVVVKNQGGEVILCKASQSGFQNPERLFALEPGDLIDRKLQPAKSASEE